VILADEGPEAASPAASRLQTDSSFAAYLAKLFIAKRGYSEGTVPEAQLLATMSDYILTKSDGFGFFILCIVDASRNATRHFGLDRARVKEIAAVCRKKYGGRVNGAKMPAMVEIVEVCNRVTPMDRQRVKPLVSRFRTLVAVYQVDLTERTVTSNFWSLTNARNRQIERALREPQLSGAALIPPPATVMPDMARRPVLTLVMLAILVAIFVGELQYAPPENGMTPSLSTVVALGGLMRDLVVQRHEWFRIFTGPLLHADAMHILFNGIAFFLSARALERLLGRAWLLALFFLGAIGGALMSLAINPPNMVSIGASGAIMCLIAAAWITSYRSPPGAVRVALQMRMLRMLIPSLIPLFAAGSGGGIDYGAHFGGAITGIAVGGAVLLTWPRDLAASRLLPVARVVAALSVLVFAFAGYEVYATQDTYRLAAGLIPNAMLPKTDADAAARADALVRDYPHDPRSHFYRALARMDTDAPGAERELRKALAEKDVLATEFKPEFEVELATYLAQTLVTEGRPDEARLAARPYCHSGPGGAVPEDLHTLGMCNGQ
jgi:rhomboid protease GluP